MLDQNSSHSSQEVSFDRATKRLIELQTNNRGVYMCAHIHPYQHYDLRLSVQ